MTGRTAVPYVLLALLLWVPSILILFPLQPAGRYVFFGFQVTRPMVLIGFFSLLFVGFLVFSTYRTWQYHAAAGTDVSATEEPGE